jgi:hypothetical protein
MTERPFGQPALVCDGAAARLHPAGIDQAQVRLPIFVFGSNLAGRHGKGAALWAKQNRGAVYGQGHGIQGDSYAIPTKGWKLETLPLWMIKGFVNEFLAYAHKYHFLRFQLTPIGCGLAGYTRAEIEPLFCGGLPNIIWPPEWAGKGVHSGASGVEKE